jgi:hypothetical protein
LSGLCEKHHFPHLSHLHNPKETTELTTLP